MKALLVTTDYLPSRGGVARYYSSLVGHLPAGRVEVLVPKPGRIWPRWLPWIWTIRAASRGYDTVWVGQVLPVGTVAWILRLLGGKRYVVSTHGMDALLPLGITWKRWLATRIMRGAAGVTANSRFTAGVISRSYRIPLERITVVYPAPAVLPPVTRAESDQPTILAVGRSVHRKGFDLLIQAMELIWKLQPEARLQIIGDGPERTKLQAAAAASSQPDKIELLGDVGDAQLAQAYSRAWVFVLPARSGGADVEGFGMVCVEAAAHGVPVVASSAGGIPEALDDGRTGLLVPADDTASLSVAIVGLLADESRRSSMSAAGLAWASRFTWQGSANELIGALSREL